MPNTIVWSNIVFQHLHLTVNLRKQIEKNELNPIHLNSLRLNGLLSAFSPSHTILIKQIQVTKISIGMPRKLISDTSNLELS